MKIYIASSFRNLHAVQMLRDSLRAAGHEVLDWTVLPKPLPEDMPPAERRVALDHDEYGSVFDFCTQACGGVDLVVYLGQAGQDSACEVGIAYAAGVPVFGLQGKLEAPGTILKRAVTQWFDDGESLLAAVADFDKNRMV